MKLASMKTPGSTPSGLHAGNHYFLHPLKMESEQQVRLFKLMGYIIFEVDDKKGKELIESARLALIHQLEVASYTEHAEMENNGDDSETTRPT